VHGVRTFTALDVTEISLTSIAPRFSETWVRVMTKADRFKLEAQAWMRVTMLSSRSLSFGHRDHVLNRGQTCRVPTWLGEDLIESGHAANAWG
jgi:hypothetical protein